jgi:hypothetical protein
MAVKAILRVASEIARNWLFRSGAIANEIRGELGVGAVCNHIGECLIHRFHQVGFATLHRETLLDVAEIAVRHAQRELRVLDDVGGSDGISDDSVNISVYQILERIRLGFVGLDRGTQPGRKLLPGRRYKDTDGLALDVFTRL